MQRCTDGHGIMQRCTDGYGIMQRCTDGHGTEGHVGLHHGSKHTSLHHCEVTQGMTSTRASQEESVRMDSSRNWRGGTMGETMEQTTRVSDGTLEARGELHRHT